MLWHKNVAEDEELVTAAQPFETSFEDDAQFVVVKKRSPAITTEGEKVEMTGLLVPLEVDRHGESLAAKPTHDQRLVMGGAPGTRHPATCAAEDEKADPPPSAKDDKL